MKLKLNKGYALIDKEDYKLVSKKRWHIGFDRTNHYVMAHLWKGKKRTTIKMHRFILECSKNLEGLSVDHINGNGLDNRKRNLRICSHRQNCWNSKSSLGKSKFKGVTHHSSGKWIARIGIHYSRIYLGTYSTEDAAAAAYNAAAKKLFGKFARLNPTRIKKFQNHRITNTYGNTSVDRNLDTILS